MRVRHLIGLVVVVLGLLPVGVDAQNAGVLSKQLCSSVTNPIAGRTVCFDQTANMWRVWTGSVWAADAMQGLGAWNARDFGAVGDGLTDDTTPIQNAINAVTATTGGVYLPPGTYRITTTLFLKSGVTLSGAGIGLTTLKVGNNVRLPAIGFSDYTPTYSNITIRDLTIDGNRANNAAGSVLTFPINNANAQWGIQFVNVVQGVITRVHVKNMSGNGILVASNFGTADVVVADCHLTANGQIGYTDRGALDVAAGNAGDIIRVTVSGCDISNNIGTGLTVEGGNASGSNVTLTANVLDNNGAGVAPSGEPQVKFVDAANIAFTGNSLTRGPGIGLFADSCLDVTISGNHIESAAGAGIKIDNGTANALRGRRIAVSGNIIANNGQVGLRTLFTVNGTNTQVQYLTIAGNVITANGANGGLEIDDTFDTTITGNTILDNTGYCILLFGKDRRIHVVGNQCGRYNGTGQTNGITEAASGGNSPDDNTYVLNKIFGATDSGPIILTGANSIANLNQTDNLNDANYDRTFSTVKVKTAQVGTPTGGEPAAGKINIATADGYLVNNTALKNLTETLSNKTLASPVISGTTTGTYTIGGTATIATTFVGPHAIGGATDPNSAFLYGGTFGPPASGSTVGMQYNPTLNINAGASAFGFLVNPILTEATTGTHPVLAGIDVTPSILNAAATTTDAIGLRIRTFAAGAGTTNASALKIDAPPTGGTNNYAIWAAGGPMRLDSAGPHAIGGALDANTGLLLGGSFTPPSGNTVGVQFNSTYPALAGASVSALLVNPVIQEAASGTHAVLAAFDLAPTITNAAATTTDAISVRLRTFAAGAGTTNAAGLKIEAAPTGATNNRSLWVAGGGIAVGASVADQGTGTLNVATAYYLNGTQGFQAGTTPTCSANCGTGPSVTGTNSLMTVALGTAPPAASTFTVTFGITWTAAPACVAHRGTTGTTPVVTGVVTTTTTAVVNLSANLVASELYHLVCGGKS